MMGSAYAKAEALLREHIDKLHEVAKFLYLNEKMSGEEFAAVMQEKKEETPAIAENAAQPDDTVSAQEQTDQAEEPANDTDENKNSEKEHESVQHETNEETE